MSIQQPSSIVDWLILIVIILAVCAAAWVFIGVIGLPVPAWVIQLLMILGAAVLTIWVIKTIARQ